MSLGEIEDRSNDFNDSSMQLMHNLILKKPFDNWRECRRNLFRNYGDILQLISNHVDLKQITQVKHLLIKVIPSLVKPIGSAQSKLQSKYQNLYNYENIDMRLKDTKESFIGIIKAKYEKDVDKSDNGSKMESSTLHIECPYDGNQITVYVKYQSKFNTTKNLQINDVVLLQNVYRKITSKFEIVCQLVLKDRSDLRLQVIGRIDRHNYQFSDIAYPSLKIIDMPSNAILRTRLNIEATIVNINFVRIKYICEACNDHLDIHSKCSKCEIPSRKLCFEAMVGIEDGTERATLRIFNENFKTAFNIQSKHEDYFKDYCKKYGNFFYKTKPEEIPNKALYDDITKMFKNSISFCTIDADVVPY